MMWLALLPFLVQALAIAFDEVYFHLKRGLPKWERIGHPLDTLTTLVCYAYLVWTPHSPTATWIYAGLALFSSLFVTKDEWVHAETCSGSENWLHALLFTTHPLALLSAGLIWAGWHEALVPLQPVLWIQLIAMSLFCLYQIIYWNCVWKPSTTTSTTR